MKRITIILIIALLLSIFSGCSGSSSDNVSTPSDVTNQEPDKYLNLAFCNNDVINPYKAVTEVNQKLSSLLYDSLVTLDSNYNVKFLLAEDIKSDGKKHIITLKSTNFSDGTPLTASDIIYSAQQAKDSGYYSDLFSCVTSITADNQKTVVIETKNIDNNFVNLLVFPIIKYNTANLTTNNNLPVPPIGCGKYTPDFDNYLLIRNENYHSKKPIANKINLVNIPDNEALSYAVSTGKISLWQDLYNGGETLTASGGTIQVVTNNLIYIGINSKNQILNLPQMRYALSAILDRNNICNETFNGYAVATSGIFNPAWSFISGLQENIDKPNNNIFLANLEEIGYNNLNTFGYHLTNDGETFAFDLVYCNDTQLKVSLANEIHSQFSKVGINTNIIGLGYEEYINALNNKEFDLYIAETIISNNMDISSLVLSDGALNYGDVFELTDTEDETSQDTEKTVYTTFDDVLSAYFNGTVGIHDVINMFNLQTPLIPICYKLDVASYQHGVECSFNYSPCDPYYIVLDSYIK